MISDAVKVSWLSQFPNWPEKLFEKFPEWFYFAQDPATCNIVGNPGWGLTTTLAGMRAAFVLAMYGVGTPNGNRSFGNPPQDQYLTHQIIGAPAIWLPNQALYHGAGVIGGVSYDNFWPAIDLYWDSFLFSGMTYTQNSYWDQILYNPRDASIPLPYFQRVYWSFYYSLTVWYGPTGVQPYRGVESYTRAAENGWDYISAIAPYELAKDFVCYFKAYTNQFQDIKSSGDLAMQQQAADVNAYAQDLKDKLSREKFDLGNQRLAMKQNADNEARNADRDILNTILNLQNLKINLQQGM